MDYLAEIMAQSKDYQLQSLIQQFTRFRKECVVNTSEEILMNSIYAAKAECDKRGISYE